MLHGHMTISKLPQKLKGMSILENFFVIQKCLIETQDGFASSTTY